MSEDNSTATNIPTTQAASMHVSPYYLSHSDNPRALITSVLLTHDNYLEWSTELRNSLQAKQKTGFIDGTITKPATEPDLSRWLAINSMIVGWIPHKLWKTLRFRFYVKNGTRLHQIQDEITNCRQDGQSVLDYYRRLTKLWEELQNMKTSRACTCAAAADIILEREDSRVHKFLFGLDDSHFTSIRSRITDEEPLPDLNIVYSRVIREEQNMVLARSKEQRTEALGFSVKTDSPKDTTISTSDTPQLRSRDPARSCTHSGRKGHDITECFLVHGYPEWFHEQQRQNGASGYRGGRGGRSNNNRGRGRANATQTTSTFNSDQIASLISLLQNQQTNLSSERLSGKTTLTDVIIDTCASHHMTGDITLLHDVLDIPSSSVTFPNGRDSHATKPGTLRLSKDYSLHDVLFVPDFNCTLISVSKLLKQTGCIAIFTDTLCVLQDRSSCTRSEYTPSTVSGKTLYPIADYMSTTAFNVKHQAFLSAITTDFAPKTSTILDSRNKSSINISRMVSEPEISLT
ncbi:PREDICTED: uncharacterized protein LOC106330956 [Brassica oleracea var. oleracea]|uniref:uncharacterized protein LOC106330956 n=1 Tax=Brassica oleracea var. oleracea TaxID=109376 RepID=UPI0006A6D255|nr:PREDICTED: uncharacterized protein LOC106330956 [Brassica oleracea var. oleracea]